MLKKYGKTRETTDDNIIRRIRFACWINKATHTHSKYVIIIGFFTAKNVDANTPQCYVTGILPGLLSLWRVANNFKH